MNAEVKSRFNVPKFEEAQEILENNLGKARMRYVEVIQYINLFDRLGLSPDGVHDVWHAGRVLVYGGNLARWEAKEGKRIRTREVEMFAPHHDRLRRHDGYDWLHGWRAGLALRNQFAGENLDLDYVLLEKMLGWHVFPDSLTPNFIREIPEMKIVEDADALDRFGVRGNLNIKYLRMNNSLILLPLAKELHEQTEKMRNSSFHPLEVVAQQAFAIGLLIA